MNKFFWGALISWSCWAQIPGDSRLDGVSELHSLWKGPPQNIFTAGPEVLELRTQERPTGQSISVRQLRHKVSKAEERSFQHAIKLSRAGEHGEAAGEIEKLLQQDPELPQAYDQLGVEYALVGRFAEAQTALRRSLELQPASWNAHYNLGLVLYDMGDLSGAEQSARRALQFSSQNPQVHLFLGYLLLLREETRAQGRKEVEFAARTIAPARSFLKTLDAR